jgi:hypothetical protein
MLGYLLVVGDYTEIISGILTDNASCQEIGLIVLFGQVVTYLLLARISANPIFSFFSLFPTSMKKYLCTLFCAALLSLPGSSHLLASTSAAPAKAVLTPAARTQSLVDLDVYIPYEGRDDDWEITLSDVGGNGSYYFTTNSTTQYSHTVGTIPSGTYNVTFHAIYPSHSRFEYYAGCNDAIVINDGDYTLQGREITPNCNNIIIDAWQ